MNGVAHLYDFDNDETIQVKPSKTEIDNLNDIKSGHRHKSYAIQLRDKLNQERMFTRKHKAAHRSRLFLALSAVISGLHSLLSSPVPLSMILVADLIVDLTFCLLYLVEASSLQKGPQWWQSNRSYSIWVAAVVLSFYSLCSFVIRLMYAKNKYSVIMDIRCLIEILTALPFVISAFLSTQVVLTFYIPYFLRSWLVNLRIKKVLQIQKDHRIFDFNISYLTEKLVILIVTLTAIIYSGMCAVNWSELMFSNDPEDEQDLFTSFYLIIVTIATVGYGDVFPTTTMGRIVIICIIVLALAVIPFLVGEIVEALRKKRAGGDSVSHMVNGYVLLVSMSDKNDEQLIDMMYQLLHEEMAQKLSIVLFSNYPLSSSVNEIMMFSKFDQNVSFINGECSYKDLNRAGISKADACFILIGDGGSYPHIKDMENILRVYTIHHQSPKLPIYMYARCPDAEKFVQSTITDFMCQVEVKQIIMAYNLLFEGTSTLLTNLLVHTKSFKKIPMRWMDQYSDGVGNEVYSLRTVSSFIGKTFSEIALFLFFEFQVILLAVWVNKADHERVLLLNPGAKYRFKPDDLFIFISQDCEQLKHLHKYSEDNLNQMISGVHEKHLKTIESVKKFRPDAPVVDDYKYNVAPYPPHYDLPDNQDAPLCIQTDVPRLMTEAEIEDATGMSNHILLITCNYSIYTFLSTMRSANLDLNSLDVILIMVDRPPTDEEWSHIERFPKVHFTVGDALSKDALIRAGIKGAKSVVIDFLSDEDVRDRFRDGKSILTCQLIATIVDIEQKSLTCTLDSRNSANFFRTKKDREGKRKMKQSDEIEVERERFLISPSYAAGRLIVPNVLDSLLVQSWKSPFVVELIKLMCGKRYKGNIEAINTLTGSSKMVHLSMISLPSDFAHKTFGELFHALVHIHGVIPIGLFRRDLGLDNEFPFVYCNPLPNSILFPTDNVYVLIEDQ